MPRMKSFETGGGGPGDWLASAHGIRNCRTVTIDTAEFAEKAKNGVIPSGTPIAKAEPPSKIARPYTGLEPFIGFLLTDQPADGGKIAVPVLDHGRVNKAHMVGWAVPKTDNTQIVYIDEGDK